MSNAARLLPISAALILAISVIGVAFVSESDAAAPKHIEYASPTESLSIRSDYFADMNTNDYIKITTKNGSMVLSSKVISNLKELTSNVVFRVSAENTDGLSQHQANEGYRTVSISLRDTDGNDQALGGKVTVYLPYELGFLELADKLSVKHIASDGTLTDMPTHYEEGYVVFETDHFSDFMIVPTYKAYVDVILIGLGVFSILMVILLVIVLMYLRYAEQKIY